MMLTCCFSQPGQIPLIDSVLCKYINAITLNHKDKKKNPVHKYLFCREHDATQRTNNMYWVLSEFKVQITLTLS